MFGLSPRQPRAPEADGPNRETAAHRAASDVSSHDHVGRLGLAGGLRVDRAANELIVPDQDPPGPGQLTKSAFLDRLRGEVCATADAALAPLGRSSEGCPQIERWFGLYGGRDAAQIERAVHRYAPETAGATTAAELIGPVVTRVRVAIDRWIATGEVTGVPDAASLTAEGVAGAAAASATLAAMTAAAAAATGATGPASAAIAAAAGAAGSASAALATGGQALGATAEAASPTVAAASSAVSSVASNALGSVGLGLASLTPADDRPDENPSAIRAQLDAGEPLMPATRVRMEDAFGQGLGHVRVHHGARANELADRLAAHAFTVGSDIAFGRSEYRPGTLAGDALIAHELAHTIQQQGASDRSSRGAGPPEADADRSTVGALAALWGGPVGRWAGSVHRPGASSGLRLSRCAATTHAPAAPTATATVASTVPWATAVSAARAEADPNRRDAQLTDLVRRAVGARTVRLAGTSSPNQVDPADYDPAPAINYDPNLNTKRKWHSTRVASSNVGYTFSVMSHGVTRSYSILGPLAIDGSRGEVHTRMYADHELFHATHHQPRPGQADNEANDEIEAWTDTFTHYFLLAPAGQQWLPLITYYERTEATTAVKSAALAAIVAFANGLPTTAAAGSTRSDRQRFEAWLRRRLADPDTATKQLVVDLSSRLGIAGGGANP